MVYLDAEATGTDPYRDRIVEICMLSDDGRELCTRVNPGMPIPAEASAVHGITDADVADAPPFAEIAPTVQLAIEGAALCGYNIRRYDTLLLDAELRRAGQPGLPRDEWGRIAVPEIDLYALWQRCEPRTLAGAARRFAGVELEHAHSARADTEILPHVLAGMAAAFGLDVSDVAMLAALSVPEGAVDRDGKFLRRPDGTVVFNFGQSRGRPVSSDPGLLDWMCRRDFSPETKAFAEAFLRAIYWGQPAESVLADAVGGGVR
ncbi:MAG TPA: 3'-5' exonuclease [Vicinamibacterales bacterium]